MDYGTEVQRRFRSPARACGIEPDVGRVFEGAAEDRSLGFWVRFQIRVESGNIARACFAAYGCPHSLAAADLVAAELQGKPVEALNSIDFEDVARRLELPREKHGKLLRIEDALAACYRHAVSKERD